MLTRSKLLLTVLVIASMVLTVSSAFAVDPSATDKAAGSAKFPYLAQPVSDSVNIRSGGGTAYYPCGKLKLGEDITVVAEEFGWAKIVPPKGSFSWIAKKYIRVDTSNPNVGFIKGDKVDDEVRVWVGSPDLDALTSSTTQTKLSEKRFDVVELLGEEDNDYLKIAPPTGAFLYVFATNLKYIGPVGAISTPVKIKPGTETDIKPPVETGNGTTVTPPKKTYTTTSKVSSPEAKKLIARCREIVELAKAETLKPYTQQDYTDLKKEVAVIAANPIVSQAKAYSEYLTRVISRYELVMLIDKELAAHAEIIRLRKIEIEKARAGKIADVPKGGKYVARGIFMASYAITGAQKYYKVLGDNGKIICYAIPGSYITDNILKRFIGKKVALEGSVIDESFATVCLVRFTDIDEIVSEK
jgi:uncharacterized protein YgiM (DUF1202 family)